MRATLPLLLGACLLALQGCIIYDHDCPGCEEGWDGDIPNHDDDCNGGPDCQSDDTAGEDVVDELTFSFYLTPSEAEVGETFIASMRGSGEDIPTYDQIQGIEFYGSPEVAMLTSDVRGYEYLLTLDVADDSPTGAVHMLVELLDGTAVWVDSALIIYDAGTGHDAGSSDDGSYDPCG